MTPKEDLAFAQGYKAKGKKENKEQVQEWFESNIPEKDTKIIMVKIGGGNSMKCMMQC